MWCGAGDHPSFGSDRKSWRRLLGLLPTGARPRHVLATGVRVRATPTTTFILFSHRPIFRRYIISADGKTATKGPIAEKKPLWYQQGCLFEEVIDEGQKSWTFTIRQAKYDDAHLFLGVADATGDGMAWAFSPTTGSLYFHADLHKWGKETKTRIMPGDALFGRKDGPPGHSSAQFVGEAAEDAAVLAEFEQLHSASVRYDRRGVESAHSLKERFNQLVAACDGNR